MKRVYSSPFLIKIKRRANKSVYFYADISWAAIYFISGKHQMDLNLYVCLQGCQQLFIKYLNKQVPIGGIW